MNKTEKKNSENEIKKKSVPFSLFFLTFLKYKKYIFNVCVGLGRSSS